MSERIEKINQLLKQHISEIINKELTIKSGVFISISKVNCSKDLKYAEILISVYPDKEGNYALKTLKKEMYKIQGHLNKKLKMKPLPRISFTLDHKQEEIEEMEKIFKKIKQEKNNS
ncbi:MAG: 30S ribosome-binding factor RbfA [Candidatus Moraniibacteriota bacterium]